jgi:hypothetical protein
MSAMRWVSAATFSAAQRQQRGRLGALDDGDAIGVADEQVAGLTVTPPIEIG